MNYSSQNNKMIKQTFQKYAVNQTITESNSHFEMINNHESLENVINVQLRVIETIQDRLFRYVTNLSLIENSKLGLYQMLLEKLFDIHDLSCIEIIDESVNIYDYNDQKQCYEE